MHWANVGNTAYTTAFKELVAEGYLVQKYGTKDIFTFYDKSQNDQKIVTIEIPKKKVKEIREINKQIDNQFRF